MFIELKDTLDEIAIFRIDTIAMIGLLDSGRSTIVLDSGEEIHVKEPYVNLINRISTWVPVASIPFDVASIPFDDES